MRRRPLLILFARAPIAGRAKTRLSPPLTPQQASELHSALARDTAEMLMTMRDAADVEISTDAETDAWSDLAVARSVQGTGDLGSRLLAALAGGLKCGRQVVIVSGSDSPALPRCNIEALMESEADVTLGPCDDGGFYAISCRRVHQEMFAGVRWSTEHTLEDVVARAAGCGLTVAQGPRWFDIDLEADLRRTARLQELSGQALVWFEKNGFR